MVEGSAPSITVVVPALRVGSEAPLEQGDGTPAVAPTSTVETGDKKKVQWSTTCLVCDLVML